jgi:hypothetical protein
MVGQGAISGEKATRRRRHLGSRVWGRKPRVGLGKGADGGEEFGVRLLALKAGGEDLEQGWQPQHVGRKPRVGRGG